MGRGAAFVPGHISGFFEMCDSDDLLKKGSRNCGLCIDSGVFTEVEVEESTDEELEIFINGERSDAETSAIAIDLLLERVDETVSIEVRHSVEAPIGSGYGMSGAGALGAVLAFSKALNMDLERTDALVEAHKAEVKCESGLGDVGPEMLGGLVIGLEPGAPPFGKWKRIEVPDNLKVVCGTMGPLSTAGLLNNPEFKERVKDLGKTALDKLLNEKSIENFMKVSREFALRMGVFDEDFEKIIQEISSESPLGASAVLLGKGVFAPCPEYRVEELEKVFLDYFEPENVMKTSINLDGANIVDYSV